MKFVNFRQTPQNRKVVVRFHGNDQLQGNCKRYDTQIWKLDLFPYSLVPRKWANQGGAAKSKFSALMWWTTMAISCFPDCSPGPGCSIWLYPWRLPRLFLETVPQTKEVIICYRLTRDCSPRVPEGVKERIPAIMQQCALQLCASQWACDVVLSTEQ